jgi:predicted transcriptional regulator
VANARIADGLVRVDTSLSRRQIEDVRQLAEQRQLTSAAIIREAVRTYLASPSIKASLEEEALA